MDSSTIMRTLIGVDNIAFEADSLFPDFQMSSDSSFVKYSMDSGVGDGDECPCMLPPPDFDIRPPPKPFSFMDGTMDLDSEFQVDIESSCPLDLPFLSNLPNDRPSVNEPLIFIITAATVMAMALIVFTIVLIWCQKKGWCKRWSSKHNTKLNSATFSSDTEESTANYSTSAGGHKTEWSFNSMKLDKTSKQSQVPNLGILMYGGGSSIPNGPLIHQHHSMKRPLPTLPKPKMCNIINRHDDDELRANMAYDSHNPVYEEISLNGLLPQRKVDDDHCYITTGGDDGVGAENLLRRGENDKLCRSSSSTKSFIDDDVASASDSPCSCQSCGKSTSIHNMEISPSPKRKVSKINQSTQSEETFMPHDDFYCECTNTNGGRESGYGTEGYPTRDNFGTWDSPKRTSPPTVPQRHNKKLNTLTSSSSKKRPQNIWVTTDDKSKRTTTTGASAGGGGVGGPPFAVFSADNLGPSSAYV